MLEKLKAKTEEYRQRRRIFLNGCSRLSPSFLLATWFGTGLGIPGPGTWGSLGGLVVVLPILFFTDAITVLMISGILFVTGLWATSQLEKKLTEHDSSFIVIDEVAAVFLLIALIALTPGMGSSFLLYAIGFLLFRLFDAWKPLIIGVADKKLTGAMGVMADDILAALAAYITCALTFALLLMLGIQC